MSDPRLVFRDDATGEGILEDDAGVRTSVHLPSVPGLRYIDETTPAAVDDGILGGGGGSAPVYPPQPEGQQVPPILPPVRPAILEPTPPTTSRSRMHPDQPVAAPPPIDYAARERWMAERRASIPQESWDAMRQASAEQSMRESLEAAPLPTDPSAPAPIPTDVPPEWLRADPGVPLPPSAEDLARRDALLHGSAPVVPTAIPPGMRGPTPEEIARGRTSETVVDGATRPHRTGRAPAPPIRTPVLSPQMVRDFSVPERFDETIAELTGQREATRGSPGNPEDLVDRQTAIAQREAQLASDDARRQQQVLAASEDERRAIEQERRTAVQAAEDRYRRAADRVAQARLDPGDWFRDQGAFGMIGSVIAVALGAVGSAIAGTEGNAALDTINAAIDRDLEAQRSEMDAASSAADLEGNMLAQVGQDFDDREAARQAARASMLDQAALELQAHTADLASDEAVVNAEALREQLASAAATEREEALDRQSERDLRAAQTRRYAAQAARDERRASGGGGVTRRYTTPMYEAFERALAGGASREEAARQTGFALEDAPRHSSMTTEQRGTLDALSTALDTLEEEVPSEDIPGVGFYDSLLPGLEGRRYRQQIDNAIDLVARLRSGAAISNEEADRFEAILGAGTFQTEEQFRDGLRILRRDLSARLGRTGERDAAPDRDLAEFGGTWVEDASP